MKVAHFSDVHGHINALQAIPGDVVALVSTGDFFPNSTRGIREIEIPFQSEWFNRNKEEIFRLFRGLPVLCVDGNHDFFGHCHPFHGTQEDMGILFSNAATAINLLDIV